MIFKAIISKCPIKPIFLRNEEQIFRLNFTAVTDRLPNRILRQRNGKKKLLQDCINFAMSMDSYVTQIEAEAEVEPVHLIYVG